jgi:hypothetical protein
MFLADAAAIRYKVFYPTMYAVESENKDAKLFNCVQVCQSVAPPNPEIAPRSVLLTDENFGGVCSGGTRTRWR